jgi:hypothetical protein
MAAGRACIARRVCLVGPDRLAVALLLSVPGHDELLDALDVVAASLPCSAERRHATVAT